MTNNIRTTYRRADNKLSVKVGEHMKHILDTAIARDYIEEQWDGDTLIRHRTVRLGANESCVMCNGRGKMWGVDVLETEYEFGCGSCNGTGVKPRDPNPTWVTVTP